MLRGVGAECWHGCRIGTVQGCASVAGGLVGSLQTSEGDDMAQRESLNRRLAGEKGKAAADAALMVATPGALNDAEAAAVVGWMVRDARTAHYFGMQALMAEQAEALRAAREVSR